MELRAGDGDAGLLAAVPDRLPRSPLRQAVPCILLLDAAFEQAS